MASCQRNYKRLHPKDKKMLQNKVEKKRCGLNDEDYPKGMTIRGPSIKRKKGSVVIPVILFPDKTTNLKGDRLF